MSSPPIFDRGCRDSVSRSFSAAVKFGEAIVTNPPFALAERSLPCARGAPLVACALLPWLLSGAARTSDPHALDLHV
jgi:hypothetical protein